MLPNNIPQASSLGRWLTAIIRVPMTAGAQFVLNGLAAIPLTLKTATLYHITDVQFLYNCGADNFISGLVPTDPAKIQLGTTSTGGEYLLANALYLGGEHPFSLNTWRKSKNENESIFILPSGIVDGSGDGFVGVAELDIICKFFITSINDKQFLSDFAGGCI